MWSHMVADVAEVAIWKALADPTRRRLLDLMRDGPRTTTALKRQFSMSRFGVMKHLRVLHDAGLVVVRRKGRERFNHLNAAPIQRIHDRWVSRYAAVSASSLTQLQRYVERDGDHMSDSNNNSLGFHIEQDLVVAAPKSQVWQALTQDIGRWWTYRVAPEGAASTISLDPRLGGWFAETWGDGEGAIWGVVTRLQKGQLLRLEGGLGMKGSGNNKYSYELEDAGDDKTRIKLSHFGYGIGDHEMENNYRGGWTGLLERYLKAWLEEGKDAKAVDAAAKS